MSESGNSRKRQCTDQDPLHQTRTSRSKRQELSEFPASQSQSPSAFWDNLSKIWLTKRALREVNRRNRQHSEPSLYLRAQRPVTLNLLAAWKRDHLSGPDILDRCTAEALRDIAQLARHGGPDISDLRGYSESMPPPGRTMSSSESSFRSRRPRVSKSTPRTKHTTNTSSTKSAGPYDRNFQQNLIDGGVFPDRYRFPNGQAPPKPSNWHEMNRRALQYRASLLPSTFSDGAHEEFVQADADAKKEDQVTKSVIPVIEGRIRDAKCVSGKIPFTNLSPLTDGTLVPGNPDLYYGARPEQLNRRVRENLSKHIIPSTQHDLPIAPNFFLAVKGPDGSLAVAGRQASYDATLGERGQVSLESWKQDGTVFDNKAHTITAIYHGGTLKLYSIHAAQSGSSENRPKYYMHQLKAYAMTSDADTFRKGAAAFRNLRDYAEEQRNGAIQRANERAEMNGHDAVDQIDDATFSFVRGTSNLTSGALADERESATSTDDVYAPPSTKRAASQGPRNRGRKLQTNEISS